MCVRWPNCGHVSPYDITPADPRLQPGWQPPEQPVNWSYGDLSPVNSDLVGSIIELEQGYKLGVRLDFSGHGDTEPHINLDIIKPSGKLHRDSEKILGEEIHFIRLFDTD